MPIGRHVRGGERGFVYIALLIGLAIIGIGLGATSEVWTQSRQREKEEELLFAGNQIRQAITAFYLQSPAALRRFPGSLDELVDDRRNPGQPLHHLRRIYTDPMTGSANWGEVRLPGGQLVGVYSRSSDTPIKQADFARRDKDFAERSLYSEWIFRSALPAANPVLAAGAGYTGPGAGNSALPLPAPAGPQRLPPSGLLPAQPRRR